MYRQIICLIKNVFHNVLTIWPMKNGFILKIHISARHIQVCIKN